MEANLLIKLCMDMFL